MSQIFLKPAWRNIIRNKTFSTLNILGLAVSLTAFILMALYIQDELSFDKFHKNAAQIYRVADDKQTPDVLLRSAQTAAPVGPALQQEFMMVKQYARIILTESLIKYKNQGFEERKVYYADAAILNFFSFDLLQGDRNNALSEPGTLVLTASTARKYFGNANPIGEILSVDGRSFKVTAVLADIPANSHIKFDFLLSMRTAEEKDSGFDWMFTNWYSNNFHTYILVDQNADIAQLQSQMTAFDVRHKEQRNTTTHRYSFEKLTDIYLHSNRENQIGAVGNIQNLYIFSAVACFILLIACINFVNLSTARSVLRAKEVAIRKVAGAARVQMAIQFFVESFLMCGIALVISVLLTYIILPVFNNFTAREITLDLFSGLHVVVLLLIFLCIGLLSGTYPAFILSGFKPVVALKGKLTSTAWGITIRKGLVVFQFSISVILVVCSLCVYMQMRFMQNSDLGFNSSQTLVINFEGDANVKKRMNVIKPALLAIQGVKSVTASSNVPGDQNAGGWSMNFARKTGDTLRTELPVYSGDYNFLSQYDIPVVAGRAFSEEFAADSLRSMLINETALKQLGFSSAADAIGVTVDMYPNEGVITGVIKDFHFKSLHNRIEPLAMRMLPFRYRLLSLQIETKNLQQTVQGIEQQWRLLVPERPLEYSFLEESFNKQYEAELKFGSVFTVFTALATGIASLGLFGLALFSVQQRKKEIGVRKVLGATVISIVTALSRDFLKLVTIAIIVSIPVSYLFMQNWLNNFAYRAPLSVWVFVLAGALAIIVAVLTIGYQTIKAAMANPVKSLRSE